MNNVLKRLKMVSVALFAVTALAACGNDSSSGTATVPNSATVFYAHNLVFRNSTTLYSTGYNGFGQLGLGDLANRTTPVAVSGLTGFAWFATGGNHSVAFFNNSTVRSWGYNGFGQLGNGSTTYSSIPVSVFRTFSTSTGKMSGSLSKVTAVAAGSNHTLALSQDKTVWAWGENTTGQLGVPSTFTPLGYSNVAVQVLIPGAPLSNITAIAANGDHSLALDSSGNVWAWGYNGTGQLGRDPNDTGAYASPKVVAGLPQDIIAIAAGGAFNYALSATGVVWAWGYSGYGQLGFFPKDDKPESQYSFTPVPLSVNGNILPVVKIAAGLKHGLFRLSNDTVWAIGDNFYGQLGNNSKADSSVPVQVLASAGVPFAGAVDIRAFGLSSMARDALGWYVWGDNGYGQLGTGGAATSLLPVKLAGF